MWEIVCNKTETLFVPSRVLNCILKTEDKVEIYLSGMGPMTKEIDDKFSVTFKEEKEQLGD